MAYYNVCPNCGAHLDPGEPCDCESIGRKHQEAMSRMFQENHSTGQFEFRFNEMASVINKDLLVNK